MRAIVIERGDAGQSVALMDFDETGLMDGDVLVRVTHSTVNYKDGLSVTGRAPIAKRFPMVPGIDLAGVVEDSSHPEFRAGDAVLLNGWGTGETHLGAWAEKSRVKGDWLLPLPAGMGPAEAMAIGTAGYTAMLSVMALERHGLSPARGPAVVTGAAGGVGSVAVALLAKAGWHVVASTGRLQEAGYLKELGAAEVVDRNELSGPARPLGKERWAAGVDSVMAPKALRAEAWARLARDLDRGKLAAMTTTVPLDGAIEAGRAIVEGKVRGRTVVEVS